MNLQETNVFTGTYLTLIEAMTEEDKIKAEYNKLNKLSLAELRAMLSNSQVEDFYGKDHIIATMLNTKYDPKKVDAIIGIDY